jgi:hypothetical protein
MSEKVSTLRVVYIAGIAAIGGLLFGFDTAVIDFTGDVPVPPPSSAARRSLPPPRVPRARSCVPMIVESPT